MTLHNYKLHNNSLQKSSRDSSETISVTKWIPSELDASIEKCANAHVALPQISDEAIFNNIINQTEAVDVNDAAKTPQTSTDSRALIENKVITRLSLEEQEGIRSNMLIMVSEAINDAQRNKVHVYNDKRQ